jgi:Protein of unknown function (DUF2789)
VETIVHNLSNLFRQLGMAGDVENIDAFLATNRLNPGTRLNEAAFWNPSQAQFLARALTEDSNWAIAADELAMRLS